MDDLISRQAAIDAVEAIAVDTRYYWAIKELPSAQPMRKEAKWKTAYLDHESMGNRPKILYCSRCNQCATYPTDFCPACGADMKGIKDE